MNDLRTDLPDTGALWLRWSWRDLRRHWVAVAAIALVLAIGIGVFASLGSTAQWRRESNDASFAALEMHDLQVTLSPGTFIAEGELAEAVRQLDTDAVVRVASERLVVESQIDASTDDESILVTARLVGMDLDAAVDRLWVRDGTAPDGRSGGVIEVKFADYWGLPPSGSVVVAGGTPLGYSGLGMIPEDFYYEGPEGTLFAQGELAPVYLPLATAQEIAGRSGQVNDLVLTLERGVDRDAFQSQLDELVDDLGVSADVTNREDTTSVRVLYEDIDNDQRFWNAVAGLVLVAGSLAAFNLISRIVEAQRREIGIGMALGVARWKLAIRPMLVGVQVALLGTLAGIGVGWLFGQLLRQFLESVLPLPIYRTEFQPSVFAQAATLGLVVPLLASALPVWRAVRVEPIEAIRTGHLTARTRGLADWTGRIRLPGSSLTLMPIRNVLRTPRRTLLTAIGVAAAITALVAVLGMLDSFGRTIDDANEELTKGGEDRVLLQLDTFYPAGSEVVTAIEATPEVGVVDYGLRLPATAVTESGEEIDLLVELIDLDQSTWTPTVEPFGSETVASGILLAPKAVEDLGLRPGDAAVIRHFVRRGSFSFDLVESEIPVAGVHANPLRPFAFMDIDQAGRFGLEGTVNIVHAYPADGASRAELERAAFGLPGTASTQAVARVSESFDEALERFIGILFVTAGAVLLLTLLIAFNATRITVEERQREHATMRAFGLPVRSVMGVVVGESLIQGILATAMGIIAGVAFLDYLLGSFMATTAPDLSVATYVSPTTILVALAIGIVAVAGAPLFLVRRLRRTNIPDTLRIME